MPDSPAACPSGPCEAGSRLLGLVRSDGTIGYLGQPLEIDDDFVAVARAGQSPERRFRFTARCREGACSQWTGTRCGVIDKVLAQSTRGGDAALPLCGIRGHCRWFRQNGVDACRACRFVITDMTPGSRG